MIYVERDAEGLRLVIEQMLEREHDLLRISAQLEGKDEEEKGRRLATAARVTYSPGYERWASHLMLLERMQKLGLPLGDLLAVEVTGLQLISDGRMRHRYKHPTCFSCGMPQDNRFQPMCLDCGVEYRRRGKR